MSDIKPSQSQRIREMEAILAWHINQTSPPSAIYCKTCGHGIEHHAANDERCIFPQSIGAPHRMCRCAKLTMPEM